MHPALAEFLDEHGAAVNGSTKPTPVDSDSLQLARKHVIVSLAGPVQSHVAKLPFHTAALEWDIGPAPEPSANPAEVQQRLQEIYRELAVQIRDLVEMLSGPDAG